MNHEKNDEPLNTLNTRKELLYEQLTYAIRGAAFTVYREMGIATYQSIISRYGVRQDLN